MSQVGYGPNDSVATPFDFWGQLSGVSSVTYTPVTNLLYIAANGTLPSVYVDLPVNAEDGAELTIVSNHIVTALVVVAGAGDTVLDTPTSLAAYTPVKLKYSLYGEVGTFNTLVGTVGTNARTWVRVV